jgi:hypothetical protein
VIEKTNRFNAFRNIVWPTGLKFEEGFAFGPPSYFQSKQIVPIESKKAVAKPSFLLQESLFAEMLDNELFHIGRDGAPIFFCGFFERGFNGGFNTKPEGGGFGHSYSHVSKC